MPFLLGYHREGTEFSSVPARSQVFLRPFARSNRRQPSGFSLQTLLRADPRWNTAQ
jgi:hypothetical protein